MTLNRFKKLLNPLGFEAKQKYMFFEGKVLSFYLLRLVFLIMHVCALSLVSMGGAEGVFLLRS